MLGKLSKDLFTRMCLASENVVSHARSYRKAKKKDTMTGS